MSKFHWQGEYFKVFYPCFLCTELIRCNKVTFLPKDYAQLRTLYSSVRAFQHKRDLIVILFANKMNFASSCGETLSKKMACESFSLVRSWLFSFFLYHCA